MNDVFVSLLYFRPQVALALHCASLRSHPRFCGHCCYAPRVASPIFELAVTATVAGEVGLRPDPCRARDAPIISQTIAFEAAGDCGNIHMSLSLPHLSQSVVAPTYRRP
jgi:hypothetical protein